MFIDIGLVLSSSFVDYYQLELIFEYHFGVLTK